MILIFDVVWDMTVWELNIVNPRILEIKTTLKVHFDENMQKRTSKLMKVSLRINPKSL